VGLFGISFGALIGAQVSDHVFLLMSDKAVEMLGTNTGSLNLGADVGIAVGPVGRTVEADFGVASGGDQQAAIAAPIYTYRCVREGGAAAAAEVPRERRWRCCCWRPLGERRRCCCC
jgi:lipid-binding SYLF domain-containing protein